MCDVLSRSVVFSVSLSLSLPLSLSLSLAFFVSFPLVFSLSAMRWAAGPSSTSKGNGPGANAAFGIQLVTVSHSPVEAARVCMCRV